LSQILTEGECWGGDCDQGGGDQITQTGHNPSSVILKQMEVQPPIETGNLILEPRHLINASIKTEHKDNLIGAVDAHNEPILVIVPSIDKEHFVLEGDDLLIEVVVA